MSTEVPGSTPEAPAPAPVTTTEPPVAAESLSQQEKTWGMLCHLLAFSVIVFWFFGNVLGPLIMWLVKKNESTFVDDQGKESVNFQISLAIVGAVLGVVSMILGVIPVLGTILSILLSIVGAGVGIYALILVITGAMKANEGIKYRYPYNLRLIK